LIKIAKKWLAMKYREAAKYYSSRVNINPHAYAAFQERKESKSKYKTKDIARLVGKNIAKKIREGVELDRSGVFFVELPEEELVAVMKIDQLSPISKYLAITFIKQEWVRYIDREGDKITDRDIEGSERADSSCRGRARRIYARLCKKAKLHSEGSGQGN